MPAAPVQLVPSLALTTVFVATFFLAAPASAQEDEDTRLAREHLGRAKVHYKLSEWDQAIAEFKEAYRLRSVAGLLFNIGQAYRMKGDYRQSRFYYQNYLRDQPNAANRSEVERQIRQLDTMIAEQRETTPEVKPEVLPRRAPVTSDARFEQEMQLPGELPEPPAPAQAVADRTTQPESRPTVTTLPSEALGPATQAEPGKLRMAPMAVSAVSAALAVAGLVTYGLARGDWGSATSGEHLRPDVDRLIASGDRKHTLSLGLGGAAAAAGVGAALLFVF